MDTRTKIKNKKRQWTSRINQNREQAEWVFKIFKALDPTRYFYRDTYDEALLIYEFAKARGVGVRKYTKNHGL